MKRHEFAEISLTEAMEWALNEFTLHILNTREIWEYYVELIKTHKENFTTLNYYNCIINRFFQYWAENHITRNLLAFNGDITQFEKFQELEQMIKDDILEYNN